MANEYFSTSNFEVSIEGMQAKQFTVIEGLQISIEDSKYAEGAQHIQKSKKGRTVYRDIVMRRRFDGDKELINWLQECSQGKLVQRSGSVILKDDSGSEVMRFNFTGAWPSSWKGPDFSSKQNSDVTEEEVTLSVETLEVA